MSISSALNERCAGSCELCNIKPATHEFAVSPKKSGFAENEVAICDDCLTAMDNKDGFYWNFLVGTIWNPEPSIQALSYRLLYTYKNEAWASQAIDACDVDEDVQTWALSAFEATPVHQDAYGNALANGDTVVLTQPLDVKGTSFSAPKGTVVKKIRLVHDNAEQIEGKINDQLIVILTKYVKKN